MPKTVVQYQAKTRDAQGIPRVRWAYAIQDAETGYYFVWSYSDKDFANYIAGRIHPVDKQDLAVNWRPHWSQCVVSDRTHDTAGRKTK